MTSEEAAIAHKEALGGSVVTTFVIDEIIPTGVVFTAAVENPVNVALFEGTVVWVDDFNEVSHDTQNVATFVFCT